VPGGEPLCKLAALSAWQQAAPGNYPALAMQHVRSWIDTDSQSRHRTALVWGRAREPPAANLQSCQATKRLPSRSWVARAPGICKRLTAVTGTTVLENGVHLYRMRTI
jgi:hypothetical protein